MRVCVFYHDKCFDGACSASLFTRFHRERIAPGSSYEYHGLLHRAGALFDESEFNGDENAIVDFKYSASPRITWWFDHHLSAFLYPPGPQNFLTCKQDRSAAIASSAIPITPPAPALSPRRLHPFRLRHGARGGVDPLGRHRGRRQVREPRMAVEMAAPAMKLTLIIESTQNPSFLPRLIPLLTEMPLAEVLSPALCGRTAAAVAGASPPGDRADPQPRGRARRNHLLRHNRPAARRL